MGEAEQDVPCAPGTELVQLVDQTQEAGPSKLMSMGFWLAKPVLFSPAPSHKLGM
jgi:hypothetical protein